MKTERIIVLTVFCTLVVVFAVLITLAYIETEVEESYQSGYTNGLLYTFQTGKVVIIHNETPQELTINQVCNNLNINGGT